MIRRLIALCTICLLGLASANAAPFRYHEGFEDKDPVKFWVSNGKYEINFKGVTDEDARTGSKSFKLDVTLKSGSYFYWQIPVRVPVAGSLRLSGWIKTSEPSNARVGIGPNYHFPPTRHSGCGPMETVTNTKGQWREISGELVEEGKGSADSIMRRYVAGASGEDVTVFLDRCGIFVLGRKGKRVVCYIDDITIEGNVPDAKEHEALARKRFQSRRDGFQKRLDAWREAVDQSAADVARFSAKAQLPDAARRLMAYTTKSIGAARDQTKRLGKIGYASPREVDELEQRIELLKYAVPNLKEIAEGAQGGAYVVFVSQAITNKRILPNTFPIPARISQQLRVTACPGEYESATFTIYAFRGLTDVRVDVGPFEGPTGSLPPAIADARAVKCWFQGKGGIGRSTKRVLKPELLLKDDGLIRVDLEKKRNFMRHTDADGRTSYVDISRDLDEGATRDDLAALCPRDAERLLPLTIPEATAQQFWLTVHVPDHAKAGDYRGQVIVRSAGAPDARLTLDLRVLPFRLAPSPLVYSIYYRSKLSPDGRPTITSEYKSEEQFLTELKDMKAHGVEYPSNYQGFNELLLRRVMELRDEARLPKGPFFSLGINTGSTAEPSKLAAKQAEVKKWLELIREYGYGELYVYGRDEAKGERLRAQRQAWRAVQEAGAKTFVAGYRKTFEEMGGLLNCLVFARWPDPEEAKKFHGVGSQIFCYANPQVGVEEPETYRRNFGLVLWQAGFDGAMDYAYQHSFSHIWNDFDNAKYRDHVFAYPTENGVIGTLAWEGFREGVDDVRYVATLKRAIRESEQKGEKLDLCRRAKAWLEGFDPKRNLDALRAEMVELILRF